MRIMLDHNVPENIRHLIQGHEVHTARYAGWDTLHNGDLLRRTANAGYDLFITADQNIQYQNYLPALGIRMITLTTNHRESIERKMNEIREAIAVSVPGQNAVVSIPDVRKES